MPLPRWRLGQTVDGQRAAVADRLASIEVPLDDRSGAGRDRSSTMSVHGEAGQFARASRSTAAARTRTRRSSSRPAGRPSPCRSTPSGIVDGREPDRVRDRRRPHQRRVRVAPPRSAARAARRSAHRRDVRRSGGRVRARRAARRSTWYVTLPDGANLVADVRRRRLSRRRPGRARGDDSFAGGLLVRHGRRASTSRAMAGKVVAPRSSRCATARAPASRTRASRSTDPRRSALPKAAPPKYIILWVMDALRADHIPIFTPGARTQMPNLEELAKTSRDLPPVLRAGQRVAGQPLEHVDRRCIRRCTTCATTAVADGGTWMLDKKFDLIATKLQEAGFFTTAVTGNGFVNEDGGYARGFKEYRNMMRETGIVNNLIYGENDRRRRDQAVRRAPQRPDLPVPRHDRHARRRGSRASRGSTSTRPARTTVRSRSTAPRRTLGIRPDSMGCSMIPPKVRHRAPARDLRQRDQLSRPAGRPARRRSSSRGGSGIRRC